MVYTDGAHVIADSLQELYAYAEKMRLSWDWLHLSGKTLHPHFDICGHVRQRVLGDKRVKRVSTKEIVRLCRLNFRPPETQDEKKEWENHHNMKMDEVPMPSEKDYKRMFDNIRKRLGC
jgi:hypothetical protein